MSISKCNEDSSDGSEDEDMAFIAKNFKKYLKIRRFEKSITGVETKNSVGPMLFPEESFALSIKCPWILGGWSAQIFDEFSIPPAMERELFYSKAREEQC
ncbi:hypothetical protein Vadar_008507 [Vaccinium darrowii]|uniref:Uncharacterized protein n=1 Tax=Vaccinium darrowii TaxID=229202 RepID=A0ACB7XXU1_9ERIC|nr:hypothetical protein Vadar_008507 [Vaccinium darrowii]